MKDKSFVLVIGESTGLQCLKNFVKNKNINIYLVISADEKYNLVIKKICDNKNIRFITKSNFIQKKQKLLFDENKKYILISIFSNLILNKYFLKKFSGKAFNLHPGILPFYAGKNCVSGAIYNNEKFTGVTLHKITEQIDAGQIIRIKKIRIEKKDNLIQLMYKLRIVGIKIINEFVKDIHFKKKIIKINNNVKMRKKFPKKIPNNGLINGKIKIKDFENLFRASDFGPYNNTWGNIFFIYKNCKKYVVKIENISSVFKKKKQSKFVSRINSKIFNLLIEKKIFTVFTK